MSVWSVKMVNSNDLIISDMLYVNRDITYDCEPHEHEFVEIEYVLSGAGVQTINGVEYEVQKGDVIFLNVGDKHGFHNNAGTVIINLIFMPKLFGNEGDEKMLLPNFIRLREEDIPQIEEVIFKIEKEGAEREIGYQSVIKNYVGILLALLSRASCHADNGTSEENFNDIIKYVDENFIDLSLSEMASKFCYNSAYFSRMFKKISGVSFSQYLTDKRIALAKDLLANTDKSMEEIAISCGFKYQGSFFRKFKEVVGHTPTRYRRLTTQIDENTKKE